MCLFTFQLFLGDIGLLANLLKLKRVLLRDCTKLTGMFKEFHDIPF